LYIPVIHQKQAALCNIFFHWQFEIKIMQQKQPDTNTNLNSEVFGKLTVTTNENWNSCKNLVPKLFDCHSAQLTSSSEMTYIVSSGALNSTHSFTHSDEAC